MSTSRDLVPIGKRDVIAKNPTQRDENGNKPLTAKALVLRNGKYGARGTGELVAVGKMSGREKLELLAGGWAFVVAVLQTYSSDLCRRGCD